MELDKKKLKYINSPALTAAKQRRIDLNLPTVESLKQLVRYRQLRSAIDTNSGGEHTLIGFWK